MQTDLLEAERGVCDAVLETEELEAVIAPKLAANHNETFIRTPRLREAQAAL